MVCALLEGVDMRHTFLFLVSLTCGVALGATAIAHALSCNWPATRAYLLLESATMDGSALEFVGPEDVSLERGASPDGDHFHVLRHMREGARYEGDDVSWYFDASEDL